MEKKIYHFQNLFTTLKKRTISFIFNFAFRSCCFPTSQTQGRSCIFFLRGYFFQGGGDGNEFQFWNASAWMRGCYARCGAWKEGADACQVPRDEGWKGTHKEARPRNCPRPWCNTKRQSCIYLHARPRTVIYDRLLYPERRKKILQMIRLQVEIRNEFAGKNYSWKRAVYLNLYFQNDRFLLQDLEGSVYLLRSANLMRNVKKNVRPPTTE